MDFGHQRAGGIYDPQIPLFSFDPDRGRYAVSAEDQYGTDRNLFDGLDEDGAAAAQLVYDVAVMHDFVVHVNGISVSFERQLDDIDGAHDTRTEAARSNTHQRFRAVIGSMDGGQRQCNLRTALLFYPNAGFPATSFAGVVPGELTMRFDEDTEDWRRQAPSRL